MRYVALYLQFRVRFGPLLKLAYSYCSVCCIELMLSSRFPISLLFISNLACIVVCCGVSVSYKLINEYEWMKWMNLAYLWTRLLVFVNCVSIGSHVALFLASLLSILLFIHSVVILLTTANWIGWGLQWWLFMDWSRPLSPRLPSGIPVGEPHKVSNKVSNLLT